MGNVLLNLNGIIKTDNPALKMKDTNESCRRPLPKNIIGLIERCIGDTDWDGILDLAEK